MLVNSFTKLLLPHSYKIMVTSDQYIFTIINKKHIIGNIYYKIAENKISFSNLYLEYYDRVRNNIITETFENNKINIVINNLRLRDVNYINTWNIYKMIEYDLLNDKYKN